MPKKYAVITGTNDQEILRVVTDAFRTSREVPLETLVSNFKIKIKMDPVVIVEEGDPKLGFYQTHYRGHIYEVVNGIVYQSPPNR